MLNEFGKGIGSGSYVSVDKADGIRGKIPLVVRWKGQGTLTGLSSIACGIEIILVKMATGYNDPELHTHQCGKDREKAVILREVLQQK